MDGAAGPEYVAERLDHLGIVAGVCREIGLADYLDAQDTHSHERIGVGTATVAMILNGLGVSNRRLYLVPQFFATKAVERLLGPGITAEDLNDDCLGRTLDWLYAHDPTILFAGMALRARRAFGIGARQVHVDTTSFAVTGEYEPDLDAHTLAVTYGYSRDHRADLKQRRLALATTRQGDVPLYLQTLDGNASDKVSLVAAVEALATQLAAAEEDEEEDEEEAPVFVADSGPLQRRERHPASAAGVRWISWVPETSAPGLAALQAGVEVGEDAWTHDGPLAWVAAPQAPAGERWVVARTTSGVEQARATLARKAEQTRGEWEKALWHLSAQRFACAPDAHNALAQQLKKRPDWLQVQSQLRAIPPTTVPTLSHRCRPRRYVWQVEATVTSRPGGAGAAALRQACFPCHQRARPLRLTRSRSRRTKTSTAWSVDLLERPAFSPPRLREKAERIVALSPSWCCVCWCTAR